MSADGSPLRATEFDGLRDRVAVAATGPLRSRARETSVPEMGRSRTMRRALGVLALTASGWTVASGAQAALPTGTSTVSLSAITATFVQSEFATHYTVVAKDLAGLTLSYHWALTLKLVDPPGSLNPSSGAHAGVDRSCTNHGVMASTTAFFVWKHGDASLGGCDHSKMGPSGHQGQVRLVLSDAKWSCTALYDGTNSGLGTAATCAQLAPPATYTCAGPQTKLFDSWNGFAVSNGATAPSFSTKGRAYCVVQMNTYHWNNGKGGAVGSIGLVSSSGARVGPFAATGSAGQGGAPNVNWTVNVKTAPTPVVINGTYTCVDSKPATWSQDQASKGQGFCNVIVVRAIPAAGAGPSGAYTCTGAVKKLFDNSNTSAVRGRATSPSFSTNGTAYCVTQLVTYHWNDARGSAPGTIGLASGAGAVLGRYRAIGTAGQGGAPNVNWTANVQTSPTPLVIKGTYACLDSNPVTWSQDPGSQGRGFCKVYGKRAVASSSTPGAGQPSSKAPTCTAGKLGIAVAPDSGTPPLTVTFALCSPRVVQWRVDFGDGGSKVAVSSPPKTLSHTYVAEGDYRPRLTVLAAPGAATASSVATSVSVHLKALISLSANPASGPSPLAVTFALATTVQHLSTWTLDFGDGTHRGGPGAPPANVTHTYPKDGSYRATFAVKPGQYALVYSVAAITVGNGTPAVLGLSASPTSGAHPLSVTFSLSSTIPGQVVSWTLLFGDGSRQVGAGRPPATVTHTYAKAGLFAAVLQVSQQQRYGGVLYEVPRGGLAISVG